MMRFLKFLSVAALAVLLATSVAEARGGGGGGGGGGRGGGGGGGGGGRGGGRFGGPGGNRAGVGNGGPQGGRFGGKSKQGDQALRDLEDRKTLIEDARNRLADADRLAHQEARLAASRLAAADDRCGDDVR